MELNLSTFLLEIVNFLVLVWILKRFLYKPVLGVIERRKADIDATLTEADEKLNEANTLRTQYEGRVADWEQERRQAREKLTREIADERERQLAELQATLADERQKAEVTEAHCRADTARKLEETALRLGGRFAARLLSLGAGAQTQARLLELLIADLQGLGEEQRARLRDAAGESPRAMEVLSAFPLGPEQLEQLRQALAATTSLDLPLHPAQDEQLIAGVQVTIGAWVLAANLRDELQGFADLAHDA